MRSCVVTLLIIHGALSIANWNNPKFIEMRDSLNKLAGCTWKAAINAGIPFDDDTALKKMCGSILKVPPQASVAEEASKVNGLLSSSKNPRLLQTATSFDLRQVYPQCWSISYVRDQSNCGSCWAVAAASSLSDRHCINSVKGGRLSQRSYSYQDLVECGTAAECGTGPNQGCNGGFIYGGFLYAQRFGLVTGEGYQNFTTCKPYSFPPNRGGQNSVAPSCQRSCASAYPNSYTNDRVFTKGHAIVSPGGASLRLIVQVAQGAIQLRGSIVAGMEVFYDFYYYRSGVYKRSTLPSNYSLGGHAVRVIGWGRTSAGVDYWIVANSWGPYWGQNGYFWMIRGVNDCGFETYMVEGLLN